MNFNWDTRKLDPISEKEKIEETHNSIESSYSCDLCGKLELGDDGEFYYESTVKSTVIKIKKITTKHCYCYVRFSIESDISDQ